MVSSEADISWDLWAIGFKWEGGFLREVPARRPGSQPYSLNAGWVSASLCQEPQLGTESGWILGELGPHVTGSLEEGQHWRTP